MFREAWITALSMQCVASKMSRAFGRVILHGPNIVLLWLLAGQDYGEFQLDAARSGPKTSRRADENTFSDAGILAYQNFGVANNQVARFPPHTKEAGRVLVQEAYRWEKTAEMAYGAHSCGSFGVGLILCDMPICCLQTNLRVERRGPRREFC